MLYIYIHYLCWIRSEKRSEKTRQPQALTSSGKLRRQRDGNSDSGRTGTSTAADATP